MLNSSLIDDLMIHSELDLLIDDLMIYLELDKLLEDTPIPMVAHHAAKLSGVRKRVASLMSTLRVIQGRIVNMDRMLNARGKFDFPLLLLVCFPVSLFLIIVFF